jgi:hypothetical protein
MKLNAHDVATPLWQKLEANYIPKLAALRARVENPELEEAKRIPLLWQIQYIKEFLELAQLDPKKVTSAG